MPKSTVTYVWEEWVGDIDRLRSRIRREKKTLDLDLNIAEIEDLPKFPISKDCTLVPVNMARSLDAPNEWTVWCGVLHTEEVMLRETNSLLNYWRNTPGDELALRAHREPEDAWRATDDSNIFREALPAAAFAIVVAVVFGAASYFYAGKPIGGVLGMSLYTVFAGLVLYSFVRGYRKTGLLPLTISESSLTLAAGALFTLPWYWAWTNVDDILPWVDNIGEAAGANGLDGIRLIIESAEEVLTNSAIATALVVLVPAVTWLLGAYALIRLASFMAVRRHEGTEIADTVSAVTISIFLLGHYLGWVAIFFIR